MKNLQKVDPANSIISSLLDSELFITLQATTVT